MHMRWILIGLVVALVAGSVAFRQLRPLSVETAKVSTGQAIEVVYATGFVEVEEPVEISARVTAPVLDVLVREGERVSKDQILARLDAADQQAQIAQAAAQTRAATLDAERTLALYKRGFASGAARDRATTSLQAAQAAERAARDRLDNFVLRSGVNGVILRRDVESGDLASPTKTLFVVGDTAQLKITATVDERDIPLIVVGQDALMSSDAYPGRVFKARVREITLGGDPDQRAFRVRLAPIGNTPLPIGLTLEINIIIKLKNGVLLIPEAAIENDEVWRVVDGKARRQNVKTGIVGPETVEIVEGLDKGDVVIIDRTDALGEGTRVRATRK